MESSVSPTAAFDSIPVLFAIRFGVTTLFTIFFRTVCSFAFSANLFLPVSDFSTKFARVEDEGLLRILHLPQRPGLLLELPPLHGAVQLVAHLQHTTVRGADL